MRCAMGPSSWFRACCDMRVVRRALSRCFCGSCHVSLEIYATKSLDFRCWEPAGIEVDEEVVLMTTKGEAIAVAIAQVRVECSSLPGLAMAAAD